MSVVQDRDSQQVTVEERRQVRHAPTTSTTVRTKPELTARTIYIARPAQKQVVSRTLRGYAVTFGVLFGLTFFSSSLAGQVMVERARKDLTETSRRTSEAKKAESLIQTRVNLLTSADRIEEWAMTHGMVASDGLGQTAMVRSDGANIH